MKKAIFLTEREAIDYINNNFGSEATLQPSYVTPERMDIDELPFTWDGECQAYNVNFGEALVGFWECEGAQYSVKLGDFVATFTSLHMARKTSDEWIEIAEDLNAECNIIIADDVTGETIDVLTPLTDEEEDHGSIESVIAEIKKLLN